MTVWYNQAPPLSLQFERSRPALFFSQPLPVFPVPSPSPSRFYRLPQKDCHLGLIPSFVYLKLIKSVSPVPVNGPLAGLGEKMVLDGDGDAQAIYDELLLQFPKLNEAGGFELLRTQDKGSKTLHIIDMPQQSYSVPYLRAVVHSARIFIRPLQRDLSLLPDKEVKIGSTHFVRLCMNIII